MDTVTRELPVVPAGPIEIIVRDRNGAYTTPRVAGRTGSSTSSAHCAAERLADKLWGIGVATPLRLGAVGESVWQIGPAAEVAR